MSPRSALFVFLAVGLLAALATGIASSREPLGTRKARLKFIAGALCGGTVSAFGLANAVLIKLEPRVVVTGMLEGLRQHHGKSSSSTFYVVPNQGPAVELETDYAGPKLMNGLAVSATYVEGYTTVTQLQLGGGWDDGWTLHEGDGGISFLFVTGFGVLIAASTNKVRKLRPDGSDAPDARKTADGVDRHSLMNLSGR